MFFRGLCQRKNSNFNICTINFKFIFMSSLAEFSFFVFGFLFIDFFFVAADIFHQRMKKSIGFTSKDRVDEKFMLSIIDSF